MKLNKQSKWTSAASHVSEGQKAAQQRDLPNATLILDCSSICGIDMGGILVYNGILLCPKGACNGFDIVSGTTGTTYWSSGFIETDVRRTSTMYLWTASSQSVISDIAEHEVIRDLEPVVIQVRCVWQALGQGHGIVVEQLGPWPGRKDITGSDEEQVWL